VLQCLSAAATSITSCSLEYENRSQSSLQRHLSLQDSVQHAVLPAQREEGAMSRTARSGSTLPRGSWSSGAPSSSQCQARALLAAAKLLVLPLLCSVVAAKIADAHSPVPGNPRRPNCCPAQVSVLLWLPLRLDRVRLQWSAAPLPTTCGCGGAQATSTWCCWTRSVRVPPLRQQLDPRCERRQRGTTMSFI